MFLMYKTYQINIFLIAIQISMKYFKLFNYFIQGYSGINLYSNKDTLA